MPLGDRKKLILRVVVDDYITTAEPVGSKTLADRLNGIFSSATLRNEMNELEGLGLLDKPHTSAGRIPSAKGYRLYVDELMKVGDLSPMEAERIDRILSGRLRELDSLITDTRSILATLTDYAVYAGTIRQGDTKLRRVDIMLLDLESCVIIAVFSANTIKNLVTSRPRDMGEDDFAQFVSVLNRRFVGRGAEDMTATAAIEAAREAGVSPEFTARVVDFLRTAAIACEQRDVSVDGAARMLTLPEFRDLDRAHELISYLSDHAAQKNLPAPEADGSVQILIGPENIRRELRDSSVITASYDLGDGVRGLIGVVGPTRMDYANIAARLGYFTKRLGGMLNERD